MLTTAENERFTQVGAGTPAGRWLRCYWHPVATSDRWSGPKTLWECEESFVFKGRQGTVTSFGDQLGIFKGQPTPIRLLGEDLVLFRDGSGRLGLVAERCPHRSASLAYGRVRADGLECFYHGWKFNVEGQCIAQPAEPPGSNFKEKVQVASYPVRELGGLIWAYLGQGEPPILPQMDVLAREDGVRAVENLGVWPCNYFQVIENSVDQTHTALLHGAEGSERHDIWNAIPAATWEEDEYGILSTHPRGDKFRTSHYVMPLINRLAQPWPGGNFQWPRYSGLWRVPLDDTHTLLFAVTFVPYLNPTKSEFPPGMASDFTLAAQFHGQRLQDYWALVSQGDVTNRSYERLGAADAGVLLLRRIISRGIEMAERGEDPKGVWRSPEWDRMIDFRNIVVDDNMGRERIG